MNTNTLKQLPTTGFFVDWNGVTRKVEDPQDGYSCNLEQCNGYVGVLVIDSAGFVIYEAVYFPTIRSVQAAIAPTHTP